MAISVGDLEAVLRLRDELSTQVRAATQAVQSAARDVQQATSQIEASVSAAGSSFTAFGTKVTGASEQSKRTLQELEKQFAETRNSLKATGQKFDEMASATEAASGKQKMLGDAVEYAGKLISTYFGAKAILNAIKNTVAWAGHIEDVSQKLGLTAEMTQRLDVAARRSGTTIDAFGTAMGLLSQKLVQGGAAVVPALERLHLSLEDLKSMAPEQALTAVGRAIGGLSSKTEQLATARQLLGRSGADLLPMFRDLDAAMNSAAVASAEQIEKVDALGDAWESLAASGKAVATAALSLVGGAKESAAATSRYAQVVIDLVDAQRMAQEEMQRTGREYDNIGLKTAQLVEKYMVLIDAHRTLAALPPLPKAPTFTGAVSAGTGLPFGAPPSLHEERLIEESSRKLQQKIDKDAREVTEGFKRYFEKWNEETRKALGDAGMAIMNFALLMQQLPTSPATKALQRLAMGIDQRTVPGILQNLAGPGTPRGQDMIRGLMGLPGAVSDRGGGEGFLAGMQGRGLSLGESLFGRSVGGFRIGGAIGDLPSTILSAVTGGGDITKSIGSLLGSSILGPDSAITKSLTGGLSNLLGKTVGGAIGSVLPGVGALLGPAISGLGKLFSNMFGGAGKKTNRERDATIEQFTGISGDKGASQAAFRKMAEEAGIAASAVDRLFSTKKIEDFQKSFKQMSDQISAFNDEQEADQQRLASAIEKYGFSFEQLGPALQKQELDKQAKELIEDWRVLVAAGIDLGTVNEKMAGSFNEYLQTAMRVGAEVPNALRPIVQQLVDQGLLTDEAGNAITDLESSGIHFSETMTEGFDRVVKKLDELIAKLGLAADAAAAIELPPTTSIPDPVGYDLPPGVQTTGYAHGTRGRYVDFGAGTPVMLHGRERVMTEGETAMSSAAMVAEMRGLRNDFGYLRATLPLALRDAVLLSR